MRRSRERKERRRSRSCFAISWMLGVGFLPNARAVKAFQSVVSAADWVEQRSLCCDGDRE